MKGPGAFMALLVVLFAVPISRGQGTSAPLTTGSRPWKMADGQFQRLRLVKLESGKNVASFQGKAGAPGFMAYSLFAPEEQAVFHELEQEKLKLVTTPGLGLHPDMEEGKIPDDFDDLYWVGELRLWQHASGKKVEASLINLNDDRASLLIGGSVKTLSLKEIGPGDLDYISRLEKGEAVMYPRRVAVTGMGWGSEPRGYQVFISGEKYAKLAAKDGSFEDALQAAVDHVGTSLKPGQWQLRSFAESMADPPVPPRSYHSIPAGKEQTSPMIYTATFVLKNPAVRDAESHWSLTMSPRSMGNPRTLYIHVTGEGQVLTAVPDPGK